MGNVPRANWTNSGTKAAASIAMAKAAIPIKKYRPALGFGRTIAGRKASSDAAMFNPRRDVAGMSPTFSRFTATPVQCLLSNDYGRSALALLGFEGCIA